MRIFTLLKTAFTKLSSLQTKLNATKDYVVEQGTSGSWRYRKWNSGIAECWVNGNKSVVISQSGFGGYFKLNGIVLNFPVDFTVTPVVNASGTGNGFMGNVAHIWADSGAVYITPVATSSSSSARTFLYHIYVIGTWK